MKKSLAKKFSSVVKGKRIIRPSTASLTIKEYKVPSVLGEPNRFFKSELEEAKKAMFFQ